METISSLLAILTGFLVRLAIPILLTALLIFLLRKLDARWQKEAQVPELVVPKLECWKIKGCPPEQVKNCLGAQSQLPCWQVFRLPNGYLREECLTCRVFAQAPMPVLRIETRRM
ncbi:MAG TPA: hypothetical protein VFR47_07960 [Anaerolineales bacterium]|nr:hypothetical protein [Anaerolineales bacterium]